MADIGTSIGNGSTTDQGTGIPGQCRTGGKAGLVDAGTFRTGTLVAVDIGTVRNPADTGNSRGVACLNSVATEGNSCCSPVVKLCMFYRFSSKISMTIIAFYIATDVVSTFEVLLVGTAASGNTGCPVGIDVAGTRGDLGT